MPTSTKPAKLKYDLNEFRRKCHAICKTGKHFSEKSHDQFDDVTEQQFLPKGIPDVSSNFEIYQETCKQYVVTSNHNFRMRSYFKLQGKVCQNDFVDFYQNGKLSLEDTKPF